MPCTFLSYQAEIGIVGKKEKEGLTLPRSLFSLVYMIDT